MPPLPEQRAIAGALSDVDALIGALDQLIAKKRDLKQAAMQQLLTGQTRLPGFSGEWEVKRLGDVARASKTANHDEPTYCNGRMQAHIHYFANDRIDVDGQLSSMHQFVTERSRSIYQLDGDIVMSMHLRQQTVSICACVDVIQR